MTHRSFSRTDVAAYLLAVLILSAHVCLAVTSAMKKSAVYDEMAFLTAGVSYWRYNDFRLHPENGVLPQRVLALPIALTDRYTFPSLDQPAWRSSKVWTLARQFFYETGNSSGEMLLRARLMNVALSVLLCILVFIWAKSLFGTAGALVSLTLCAFSPTVLAHARWATGDLCTSLMLLLATYALWRLFACPSLPTLLLASVACAGAALSKLTAVLLAPLLIVGICSWCVSKEPVNWTFSRWLSGTARTLSAKLALGAAMALGLFVLSLPLIWAAYGFRYSTVPDAGEEFQFYRQQLVSDSADNAGLAGEILSWCENRRVLPQSFLYGARFVLAHRHRQAFFAGEYSRNGWWSYFPCLFLLKTPLSTQILMLIGLCAVAWSVARRHTPVAHALVLLVAFIVIYGATAVLSTLNIGHRHILPVYPALFVLAGAVASILTLGRRALLAISLLLVFSLAECYRAYPDFLAYFNWCLPRSRAYQYFVDSNLDWGQDLPQLAAELEMLQANDPRHAYVAYFGKSDLAYYGVKATPIDIRSATGRVESLHGGWYCVSATTLQTVYARWPGVWSDKYERLYQEAQAQWARCIQIPPATLRRRVQQGDQEMIRAYSSYELLRACRLMAFLRQREPVHLVGYSILLFDLSDEEARSAEFGPPPANR